MANGMKTAFLVSLVVNIFVIGVLSGQFLTRGDHRPAVVPTSTSSPLRMMRYARELPPESKETFRNVLRTEIPELREKRENLRALERIYDQALHDETWDRSAVDAALRDVQAVRAEIRALIDVTFLDAVESLSREDRALLRKSDRKNRRNRGERHKRHDKRDDH